LLIANSTETDLE